MSWKRFAIPALVCISAILAQGQVRRSTAPTALQSGSNAAAKTSSGSSSSAGTVTGWRTQGINVTHPVTQAAAQVPLTEQYVPSGTISLLAKAGVICYLLMVIREKRAY